MKKILSLLAKSSVIIVIAYIAQLYKISFMVGSQAAWLSGVGIIIPLIGAFTGIAGTALLFTVRTVLFSSGALYSSQFLAFILPGVSASLYWATNNIIIRLLLPLACMMAFIAHPVGFAAFSYSLFWLIPVALYFVQKKSVITNSLASTFIAHGVGSVIWLYTVPMQASDWISLIPVVFVERLVFASGMVVMHYVFSYVFALAEQDSPSKQSVFCKRSA